jgi:hypothetical protein
MQSWGNIRDCYEKSCKKQKGMKSGEWFSKLEKVCTEANLDCY